MLFVPIKNLFLHLLILMTICLSCEAGLRIIGGRDAMKNEFPYAVRIERHYYPTELVDASLRAQYCTGAALTQTWILSAAHCVPNKPFFKRLIVRYNSYFPTDVGKTEYVEEAITHPGYHDSELRYDIGLLRSVNIFVTRYAKVSSVDYLSLIGHEAVTLGFGRTNASQIEKPLQVMKGMINHCLELDTYDDFIDLVSMVCLVPPCGLETTICGGDSGGPVVHASGIIGVNSMALNDCDENTEVLELEPGTSASIIATVSHAIDWLSNVIANKTK